MERSGAGYLVVLGQMVRLLADLQVRRRTMITTELGEDIGHLICVLQGLNEDRARKIVLGVCAALVDEREGAKPLHRALVNAALRGDYEQAEAERERYLAAFPRPYDTE